MYWCHTIMILVKYNKILVTHKHNWFGTIKGIANLHSDSSKKQMALYLPPSNPDLDYESTYYLILGNI